jgi:hypothetical protein
VRGVEAEFFEDDFIAQLRWVEAGQGLILALDQPCDNRTTPFAAMLRIARQLTVPSS